MKDKLYAGLIKKGDKHYHKYKTTGDYKEKQKAKYNYNRAQAVLTDISSPKSKNTNVNVNIKKNQHKTLFGKFGLTFNIKKDNSNKHK